MKRFGLFILVLLLFAPAALRTSGQAIQIGTWPDGSIQINDGWRVHLGDNLAWAQPGFDDASWDRVSLEHQNANPFGWQWYRLRVQLPQQSPPLVLLIEASNGTYEVYLDGRRVPETELLPSPLITNPEAKIIPLDNSGSTVEIALRTFVPEVSSFISVRDAIRVHLGTKAASETAWNASRGDSFRVAGPSIIINLLIVFCGFGVLGLYRAQRGHREYLWLGLYLILLGAGTASFQLSGARVLPISADWFVADPLLYLFTVMQIEFTFSFAGRRVGRGWRIYEAILIAYPLLMQYPTWRNAISVAQFNFVEALLIVPVAILLPVLLLVWYLRGNREAGWLIIPSLLPNASIALNDLRTIPAFFGWKRAAFLTNPTRLGSTLSLFDLANLLFLLAIGVVMFFRFTRVSREQARSAAELEAARSIQSLLIPATPPNTPGFDVESVYIPASEVGGDFFQVLPGDDSSLLVVVGDVSGKGLKAAMTVSTIIGALRDQKERQPAQVLAHLNCVLHGQISGFVTCTAALIAPDRNMTVANAGNLAPYRNGEELIVESGLPLGILPDSSYSETTYQLNPGDHLIFVSDGVVEATNDQRELFGFERTRAISGQSASAIAEAARKFGQQDDISVLSVTRTAVLEHATA